MKLFCHLSFEHYNSIFCFIVFNLVLFAIVPNSFAISLIGFFLAAVWLFHTILTKRSYLETFQFQNKVFF